jgi:hypothetical protein
MTLGFGIASATGALSALNATAEGATRQQKKNQLRISAASYGGWAQGRRKGGGGREGAGLGPVALGV